VLSLLSNACYINYPRHINLITYVWYILGGTTGVQRTFLGKPEGKELLGRHVEMEGKKLFFKVEDKGSGFDMDTEWDFVNAAMKNLKPQDTGIS